MEGRELKTTVDFTPWHDQVILKGERVIRRIILTETDDGGILYKKLEVVGYGPLTRYAELEDSIKLSDFSQSFAPELLWTDEPDEGEEGGIFDYLLVSEAFIKGKWDGRFLNEEDGD